MTKKPGPWIAWNGGKMPVHAKTKVEVVYMDHVIGAPHSSVDVAGEHEWHCTAVDDGVSIITYRVLGRTVRLLVFHARMWSH